MTPKTRQTLSIWLILFAICNFVWWMSGFNYNTRGADEALGALITLGFPTFVAFERVKDSDDTYTIA